MIASSGLEGEIVHWMWVRFDLSLYRRNERDWSRSLWIVDEDLLMKV